MGRHLSIPYVSKKVVGLLHEWIGNDVLTGCGYKAMHCGCCIVAGVSPSMLTVSNISFWALLGTFGEPSMFPCEQITTSSAPILKWDRIAYQEVFTKQHPPPRCQRLWAKHSTRSVLCKSNTSRLLRPWQIFVAKWYNVLYQISTKRNLASSWIVRQWRPD